MGKRHPALARLDVLVGRWTVQPEVEGLGAGWTEFSWVEEGRFVWRMWREASGFHQRFIGTLGVDGAAMDGRWERSADGTDWALDFKLAYRR
ncbi:hypothetical protein [Micromonospora sp. NPDC005305]|uniref:hypothetical protein n=1 Tax=Micromonospora sp. NPDC005305 TaxID=3156875 RepID=UPI00339DDEDD